MNNPIIDDYIRQMRKQLAHLPIRRRDAVLDEIRAHLEEEAHLLRKEDKSLSRDEAALTATNKFGDPREISVAYGPEGGVVKRGTGEILLDVAVLTGRGVGGAVKGTLKWTSIVALVILATGLVVGGGLLWLFQDVISDNLDDAAQTRVRTLMSHSEQYDSETSTFTDSFEITSNTVQSRLRLDVTDSEATIGCVQITITDPAGGTFYESGQICNGVSKEWSPSRAGTYQVRMQFTVFTGSVSMDGWAEERIRQDP